MMSDTETGSEDDQGEDPKAFFDRLRDELGIDFGDPTDDPSAEARELMDAHVEKHSAPAPAPEYDAVEETHYPGSKQALKAVTSEDLGSSEEPDEVVEDAVWDTSPRTYLVKGKSTEFFTIEHLATALHRKPTTIRKWERQGYLPEAQFRTPDRKSRATGQVIQRGNRLYTRAQVEGLLRIAKDENLMHPRKKRRIDQSNFQQRAEELFAKLASGGN